MCVYSLYILSISSNDFIIFKISFRVTPRRMLMVPSPANMVLTSASPMFMKCALSTNSPATSAPSAPAILTTALSLSFNVWRSMRVIHPRVLLASPQPLQRPPMSPGLTSPPATRRSTLLSRTKVPTPLLSMTMCHGC